MPVRAKTSQDIARTLEKHQGAYMDSRRYELSWYRLAKSDTHDMLQIQQPPQQLPGYDWWTPFPSGYQGSYRKGKHSGFVIYEEWDIRDKLPDTPGDIWPLCNTDRESHQIGSSQAVLPPDSHVEQDEGGTHQGRLGIPTRENQSRLCWLPLGVIHGQAQGRHKTICPSAKRRQTDHHPWISRDLKWLLKKVKWNNIAPTQTSQNWRTKSKITSIGNTGHMRKIYTQPSLPQTTRVAWIKNTINVSGPSSDTIKKTQLALLP